MNIIGLIVKIWKAIDGYKTYIICTIAILSALAQVWSGAIDWQTAYEMIIASIGGMALRNGMPPKN